MPRVRLTEKWRAVNLDKGVNVCLPQSERTSLSSEFLFLCLKMMTEEKPEVSSDVSAVTMQLMKLEVSKALKKMETCSLHICFCNVRAVLPFVLLVAVIHYASVQR